MIARALRKRKKSLERKHVILGNRVNSKHGIVDDGTMSCAHDAHAEPAATLVEDHTAGAYNVMTLYDNAMP